MEGNIANLSVNIATPQISFQFQASALNRF